MREGFPCGLHSYTASRYETQRMPACTSTDPSDWTRQCMGASGAAASAEGGGAGSVAVYPVASTVAIAAAASVSSGRRTQAFSVA